MLTNVHFLPFRKYLMCPTSLPLHEIFYYNSTRRIKQCLNASPRSALQTALSNPNYYLQVRKQKARLSFFSLIIPTQ